MRNRLCYFSLLAALLCAGLILCCSGGGSGGSQSPPPPPGPNAITLTLQSNQQFQTWEAWRATASGPYFPTATGPQLISGTLLDQILNDLAFDLGLNGFRFELSGAQFAQAGFDPCSGNVSTFNFSRTYTLEGGTNLIDPVKKMNMVVLALRSKVQSRRDPFYTYFTSIYDFSSIPTCWHTNAQLYAAYAEAVVNWSKSSFNGYVPDYWVIYNEPASQIFSNDSEMANDIVATGARFVTDGFPTKIQTIETSTPQPGTTQNVLNVAGVPAVVRLLSYHGYDYGAGSVPSFSARNQIRDIARNLGVRTAMTEICCQSGWNGSYAQALGWARDIYWNMTEGNISIWEPLAAMFPCSSAGCPSGGQDTIVLDTDLSRYFKFPAYYGLRQFSHYIRPGYTRIGITCSACTSNTTVGQNIKPVAFQTPAGGMVVVVVNDQSGSQDIAIAGLPAGTYNITGVDPINTTGKTYPPQVIAAGQSLVITFPAQAILTFVKQ